MVRILFIIVIAIGLVSCNQSDADKALQKRGPVIVTNSMANNTDNIETVKKIQSVCPQAEDLIKNNDQWQTASGSWQTFTSTTANKIIGFIGAQWVGVKLGKIICLYQTDEAVAFPLAVEHTSTESVYEPNGDGWSALTGSRKFCKSTNIIDCKYFIEQPKEMGDIYKQIQYDPSRIKNENE